MLFRPQRGDHYMSLSIDRPKGVHSEDNTLWRNVGGLGTYISYLICQVKPDIHTMINKSRMTHYIIVSFNDISFIWLIYTIV
jgi:hypothetical protein